MKCQSQEMKSTFDAHCNINVENSFNQLINQSYTQSTGACVCVEMLAVVKKTKSMVWLGWAGLALVGR